jgi:hypothetical protein
MGATVALRTEHDQDDDMNRENVGRACSVWKRSERYTTF